MCVRVLMGFFVDLARRLPIVAFGAMAFGLVAPVAGCAEDEAATSAEDEIKKSGKLQLLVTVDWEGRDLSDANLEAMRNLHARFPEVKIVHFLNAAYFTKQGADADDTTARIASAIFPGDEKGLHIHGWKRLFEASGVTFKNAPTFWGTAVRQSECVYDCGHEVPISLYSADELRKVVRFSLDTLESQGLGRARSFRCGGWMARDTVREAVAAEGLVFEESAVPTSFLKAQLGGRPIYTWLDELWKGTVETSQPYALPTAAGDLVEVPDNGALADYASAEQMVATFEANKAVYLRDRSKNIVVSVGFHHETAAQHVPKLEAALARMYAIAKAEKVPFVSITTDGIDLPR